MGSYFHILTKTFMMESEIPRIGNSHETFFRLASSRNLINLKFVISFSNIANILYECYRTNFLIL